MPRSFIHLDFAGPFIDLPLSRKGIYVSDFQILTRNELATAQSTNLELKHLRLWIDEQ